LCRFDGEGFESYHNDHLGTPRELTDERGEVVWSASYDVYGRLNLLQANESENQIRFQGQYEDRETGLHYNFHRYFDPESARYINKDPIGLLGGLNPYDYTLNPVNWVDPLGLEECETAPRGASRKGAGRGNAPVTKDSLIKALTGTTEQANRIASAISQGKVSVNILGQKMFEIAYQKRGGLGAVDDVTAFASGERIYLRKDSASIVSDTVHEGTHALDYKQGFSGTDHQWEKRAYFYERQFQMATRRPVDFQNISDMLDHIRQYY
jgi:RHS repeat-associated protein